MQSIRNPPLVFLTPFLVILVFVLIVPLVIGIYTSTYGGAGLSYAQYVGLGNYAQVLADTKFWGSILNMLYFSAMSIPVVLGVTVGLALFLDSKIVKAKTILKLIIFLPYGVPTVITALLWSFLYDSRVGPIPVLFRALGMDVNMLSAGNAYYAMLLMVLWSWAGFFVIIILAGLKTIPTSIYESAQLDGASSFSVISSIKLPIIKSFVIMVLAMTLINNLLLFNEPYILGLLVGLPDNFTPNVYIYNMTYKWSLFGYGASMAFVLVLVSFLLSFVFLYFTLLRRR